MMIQIKFFVFLFFKWAMNKSVELLIILISFQKIAKLLDFDHTFELGPQIKRFKG
jgi:hypothetical protein